MDYLFHKQTDHIAIKKDNSRLKDFQIKKPEVLQILFIYVFHSTKNLISALFSKKTVISLKVCPSIGRLDPVSESDK